MNIEQVHSCSWSIVIPKSVVPALQNYIHMYASSNISISRTTLYLGPVMYVWKCVQCRLWPQKKIRVSDVFVLDWVRCIIFGKKPQTHLSYLIMCLLYFLDLYFLKLLLNQGWYWCQRGGWLSSLQHHSGGFLLFTKFEFFDSVIIMASYFTRLMINLVKQRWRPLLSLTGDNVQIYCESTAQVIAVCALFATHAIVLNWYSVCRSLIYSH